MELKEMSKEKIIEERNRMFVVGAKTAIDTIINSGVLESGKEKPYLRIEFSQINAIKKMLLE